MNKLTPLQTRVLGIIKRHPNAADDDSDLLSRYWYAFDGWNDDNPLYDNLRKATSPESLSRARRKLHELGYIQYSSEAYEAREKLFKQYQDENSNLQQRFI